MPPGPLYNWLCVAHSVCDILSHAAQIRAAQVASATNTSLYSRYDRSGAAKPQETPLGGLHDIRHEIAGGKPVHTAVPDNNLSLESTASQVPVSSVASVVGTKEDGEVIQREETEHMRRPRGDLVSTRLQPMHRPALQDDDARPCSSVETPLAPFASSSSPSTLSTAPEQHTPPGLATVGETNSPSPTPQPTFHDPVPHVSTTSMQHALSNNSAIMMSAEDPSREVLDRALAKEASPVIGSTSEVPAHDVPSMTGAPEPAEPVRFCMAQFDDETHSPL